VKHMEKHIVVFQNGELKVNGKIAIITVKEAKEMLKFKVAFL